MSPLPAAFFQFFAKCIVIWLNGCWADHASLDPVSYPHLLSETFLASVDERFLFHFLRPVEDLQYDIALNHSCL